MKIDTEDIWKQFEERGWAEVRRRYCYLTIEKRPQYCDRGRYIVKCTVTGKPHEMKVDGADMFPHYYFGFEAMISELEHWFEARGQ